MLWRRASASVTRKLASPPAREGRRKGRCSWRERPLAPRLHRKRHPPHQSQRQATSIDMPDLRPIEQLVHDPSPEMSCAAAGDPRLTEELALALLERRDLPPTALEGLARHPGLKKSPKVQLALVTHPRTPRFISLPLLRHLHTFELMKVALTPAVAADVKTAADEVILSRQETISAGEKLTLAKRGSGRVAGALLLDPEPRIVEAALHNPQLSEALVVKALARERAPAALAELVCRHPQWSLRRDVQRTLLRHPGTPLGRVLVFARNLPAEALREIMRNSRLNKNVRAYLMQELESRETDPAVLGSKANQE